MLGLALRPYSPAVVQQTGLFPTLDYDFTAGTLPAAVTFSRVSTATRTNSAGWLETVAANVPRFDYAPVAATVNLLTYSTDLANAAFTKQRATISSGITAPDGSVSAFKLVEVTNTATSRYIQQLFDITSGVTYGFSIYAKSAERSQISLRFGSSVPAGSVTFDLNAGTASVVGGTVTASAISPVGNGWYRCFVAYTANATASGVGAQVFVLNGGTIAYDGVAGNGVLLYGAQLEQSATVGPYVPTSGIPARLGGSATNLLTYSEQFDNAAWTKTGVGTATAPVVTANAGLAPDGTATADRLVLALNGGTTSGDRSEIAQAFTTVVGTTYTMSVWMRTEDGSTRTVRTDFNGQGGDNNTVTGTWTRFAHTFTAASSTNRPMIRLRGGLGTSDSATLLVWGAQFEQSFSLGPYVATTTTAATATVTEPRGLLIEEARSNLLLRSAEVEDAAWTKARATVTANAATAPDGTITADKLIEDATASQTHYVVQTPTITAGAVTFSVYLKADTRTRANLLLDATGGNFANALVDLSAGTVSGTATGTMTGRTASATPVGGSWWRCVLTVTTVATSVQCQVRLVNAAGTDTYTGDGTSGLFVWGAQLEVGSFQTSFIPTTTAAVTRASDVATVTSLAGWYNPTEGTVFAEASRPAFGHTAWPWLLSFDDGTSANRMGMFHDDPATDRMAGAVRVGSVSQASLASTQNLTPGGVFRAALAYKLNDFAASVNGETAATDTSGTVPTVGRLRIGMGDTNWNGHVRKVRVFRTRRSNADLQSITQP